MTMTPIPIVGGALIMNHSFLIRLKMLKFSDFVSGIKLLIAIPFAIIFSFFKKDIWLICESEKEARDNGYWFYKYICDNHPEIDVIYAIDKKSPDYMKVCNLGKTCEFGTVRHWIYYLIAKYNISTQKGGKPNAAICYVLEIYGILKNKRIFLQHGITYNDAEWLYYQNTKMRLFVCGAKPEYEYVKQRFGYPSGYVKYLGFPRFDNLINTPKTNLKKRIIVMPTWREWLVIHTKMSEISNYDGNFKNTDYYKYWKALLENKELHNLLERYETELLFFPHRNMQPFLSNFSTCNQNIKIASWEDYDVQDLLINSDLMITDYSSVFFDYAYLKKPIIFYQFDYQEFREGQYKEGYFDFDRQELGKVCYSLQKLLYEIENVMKNNFVLEEKYIKNMGDFFALNDNKNSERIFNEIQKI